MKKRCDYWTCQTIFEVKNESITCPNFFSTLDITWFDLTIMHKKINHFIVCWIKAKDLIWEFPRSLGWFNVKNFDCHFLSIKPAIVDPAKPSSSNFSLEVFSCSNNFSTRISFKCRRYNTHVVSYNMPCARSLHKYIITSMHIILIGQEVDDNPIV